ncbi:SigE family RNA polymerase sigma factor [Virgisporangium aurantiacum]|uniref:RNA polymerase n=1 Tax=Virgisporangium aurantiacum TaxID=175570 RepID=A0A8J3Z7R9_9ACTN|nr:SigE family RNA polymerase sigma factor [Virgisporangium aurantiacum]GIJ56468.1 RNA polymerase [Virgisporangium aurantiacum]
MEFDDFVRARGAALVRLARLLTGDRHRGEDLTQEVLARAFVSWKRIAAMRAPEAYLRRMLVNAAITRGRRMSSRELVVADTGDPAGRSDLEAEVADRDVLWAYVRRLPAKQRAAVVLRYYEDLDDATIAELLNCSAVTVRTQVKRALDALRGALDTDTELFSTGGSR